MAHTHHQRRVSLPPRCTRRTVRFYLTSIFSSRFFSSSVFTFKVFSHHIAAAVQSVVHILIFAFVKHIPRPAGQSFFYFSRIFFFKYFHLYFSQPCCSRPTVCQTRFKYFLSSQILMSLKLFSCHNCGISNLILVFFFLGHSLRFSSQKG